MGTELETQGEQTHRLEREREREGGGGGEKGERDIYCQTD